VQAPVLIFHGSADRNVPPAQSWSYYRALQYFNKTVKYVVFPGEPHGPRKLTHQMRKVEEEAAWFDKYFFKTEKTTNEAVKSDSILADALRRKNIQTYGDSYGTRVEPGAGVAQWLLKPEVVRRGDLEIGRFETTWAQYQNFGISTGQKASVRNQALPKSGGGMPRRVPPNVSNLPVHGVTLEQAKAYAAWLSQQTGETWRLPYEDEVKDLYENRDGENTLDYWAGYTPNPEDTARLREKAKEVKGAAPLLKEVGSFHGQGRENVEPIYDLGGNVAEWVLTRDAKGKVIGGSADCPADPKSNCTPAPEYIGFRVVRGAAKPAPEN
jgi:hypothetical protein